MILDVSKGHIKVEIRGKVITVPGEMFFPANEKIGFAVFENQIQKWDYPNESIGLTPEDVQEIIEDIRQDFSKGGHILEVE